MARAVKDYNRSPRDQESDKTAFHLTPRTLWVILDEGTVPMPTYAERDSNSHTHH
jgi:hypothetical protein